MAERNLGIPQGETNQNGCVDMKNTQKYYKVVFINYLSKLTSAVATSAYQTYKVGEFVKAKIGGLFVFDNLHAAVKFCREFHHSQWHTIYECEVEDPIEPPPFEPFPSMLAETIIKKRWSAKNRRRGSAGWPHGTKTFKKVKLTRLVKY